MMTKKIIAKCTLIVFVLLTVACGGLRFNQSAPEAKDFHPKRIAVFPIEVWNHKEVDSRAIVEQIVAESLVKKQFFENVMDVESLQKKISENEALRNAKNEYLSKMQMLNFTDADLSRKIGDMLKIDAFLLLSVDEWKYYAEGDKKIAEVGLSMAMYDIATGKVMWKANHAKISDYVLLKPGLSGIARDVVNKMIDYMPH
jgi:hypothetical protein